MTGQINELTEEISRLKSSLMKKDYKYDINAYFCEQLKNHLSIINRNEYKLAQNNQLAYLFITTYQNDNYVFWGISINRNLIFMKSLKRLMNILSTDEVKYN